MKHVIILTTEEAESILKNHYSKMESAVAVETDIERKEVVVQIRDLEDID
jgi:hypothetical protein